MYRLKKPLVLYKVEAVSVTKVADAGGPPAPTPTTTTSAPVSDGSILGTAGGGDAEVEETVGKEG